MLSRHAANWLLSVVLPDDCRICQTPLQQISRVPICDACLSQPVPLQFEFSCRACGTPFVNSFSLNEAGLCFDCQTYPPAFQGAYTFGSFEGTLRQLILQFKYARIETLAGPLSRLLLTAIPSDARFDLVIPMPLHWTKKWQRGFNQAEALARPIAARWSVPLSRALSRRKATRAQAGLTRAERQSNLHRAFHVRKPAQLAGKKILLVDDVFTTGATLRAAARALQLAGAGQVMVVTLARVERRRTDTEFAARKRKSTAATASPMGESASSRSYY